MSLFRRGRLPAWLVCLPVLAATALTARAADDAPPQTLDAKAVDAAVYKNLRDVINEGADMYNAQGKYANMERNYAGCYYFYQGALTATRPLLAGRPELQKAIDEGLQNAANTPEVTKRAFVLREVIDKVRDAVKDKTAVPPPTPIAEKTATGTVTKADALHLTVKGDDGKEKVYAVSDDTTVTIDGKAGRVDDIKKDSTVTVTIKGDTVTKIVAKAPAVPLPKEITVTGKVTKSADGRITVKPETGDSRDFTVADEVVTIDGKPGKAADIKADSTATVTIDKDGKLTAVAVKAPVGVPPPPPKETTVTGKAVSAEKGKLTASVDGKDKTYTIPEDAKVTIDGKDGKAEDVKKDSTLTITLKGDVVTKVEAKAAVALPAPKVSTVLGKVVGVEKDKLTVSVDDKDKVFTVPAAAKVMIDDKDGKLEDLKKDSNVLITSKDDAVVTVEAKSPVPPPAETTLRGIVTKLDKDRLTIKGLVDDKDTTVTIPADAKITIDGKDGKAADIKTDSIATVTKKGDAVTQVDAKSPPPPPPTKEKTTKGTVTKNDKGKLTVKDDAGKESTVLVPLNAKVTIDGKDGDAEDIKADSTITITSDKDGAITKVEAKAPGAPPPPPPAQTLWDRLGGEANVAKVVDDLVNTAGKDPKVNFFRDPTFEPSKEQVADLKKKLVEFVSSATGGPLKYTGKDMKEAHKGMKITDDEFNALAADLKAALEKNGRKADDVKAVLAAVEGTRKDIVEVKAPEDKDKPKPPEDKPKPHEDKPQPPADKPAETGSVSGKVAYEGLPLNGGAVLFVPADGKEASAAIGPDGTYKLENVKAGEYAVAVDPTKPNPAAAVIPKKFTDPKTSGLKVTIRKDKNVFDIQLED